jgi:cobalt/nickel transport system permease protein
MHIHIPDGVLPVWLWVLGYIVSIILVTFAIRRVRGEERKGILAAVMVAVMLVVQSIPLGVPYHINLSALTGIMLGPWWSIIAILVTNAVQASFGHGGVTIIGLNTIVVWSEALIGYYLFTIIQKVVGRSRAKSPLAAGFSTLVALIFSAFLVVGIVAVSGIDPTQALGPHLHEQSLPGGVTQISLEVFMILVLPIAIAGAFIESLITGLLVAYVIRVKPSLVSLED